MLFKRKRIPFIIPDDARELTDSGISNPDLIYPGQEIKFGSSNSSGSATSVQTTTQGTSSTKNATTCIHPKVKVYEQEALRSKELARELIASSSYCPKLPQKVSSDNIEKKSRTSGRWGTINNREALAMRMQDYRGTALNKMNGTHLEEIPKGSGNWEKVDNIFSKSGCLMQATAKLATEIKGEKVSLLDVNDKFDTNTDGNLSFEEIKSGLEDCLPEGKYLIAKEIKSVTKENFDNISDMGTNTFVIGKADDVAGGDHWINLGSYRMNEYNQVEFSYSPTSENDVNNHRRYVLGSILDGQENFHSISRAYTFTVCDSMLLMK